MSRIRLQRLVCHHCAVPLKKDDREHYGYECHDCVVREHELFVAWTQDPDHPDAERLFAGPGDIGYGATSDRIRVRPAVTPAR